MTEAELGFDEDEGFQAGHSGRPPVFARDLLMLLGVEGLDPVAQRAAVAAWLAENPAGTALMRSLRRAGLA